MQSIKQSYKHKRTNSPWVFFKCIVLVRNVTMSESESSDHDDSTELGMAGNPPGDISCQANDLLQSTESSRYCSKANKGEVLGELSKLYEGTEGTVSNPINAKLASLVDKMVKTSLSEENIKEKHEKYNRPENCENLINTRVNSETWSKIRSNTRSGDLKMQKTWDRSSEEYDSYCQNVWQVTGVEIQLQICIWKLCVWVSSTLTWFSRSYGHSFNEVNTKRREHIKPDLNDQFKQLCGSHMPVTKLLFGDYLPKSVKEISETNTESAHQGFDETTDTL